MSADASAGRRPGRARDRVFVAACALVFVAGAAMTVQLRRGMAGGMPMGDGAPLAGGPTMGGGTLMPGAPAMAGAWMPLPGQSRLAAALWFTGMWVAMMVAMMMPSLAPALAGYRRLVSEPSGLRLGAQTLVAGVGYFAVWALVGAAAYAVGAPLAAALVPRGALARAVPLGAGVVVTLAGAFQLTAWKRRQLQRCRSAGCGRAPGTGVGGAWSFGLLLGVSCALCCAGYMIALLAAGMMDLTVMAAIAAAITLERLAPWPARAAVLAGAIAVGAGGLAIARALGAG